MPTAKLGRNVAREFYRATHPRSDIRTVQVLLDHRSVETTMIYTHVLANGRGPVRRPLDLRRRPG